MSPHSASSPSSSSSSSSSSPSLPSRSQATFGRFELAIVLSHYDLGAVESVTEFNRGSRQSPKVGIVCERGKFLLKRRSIERAEPDRVRFAHRVQGRLAANAFPAAKLVGPRGQQQTFLQLRGQVYELFAFVPGQAFEKTSPQARSAGAVLAEFHEATEAMIPSSRLPEPHGDYHDRPGVRTGLCSLTPKLSLHDSMVGNEADLAALLEWLLAAYDTASHRVNGLGFRDLKTCVIHGDWHPGNLLFRGDAVLAAVDYDSVRWSTSVVDIANGALQFSMCANGAIEGWPAELDLDRFAAFLAGYGWAQRLTEAERECVADLMCEALIAECVPPISQTGSVGRWDGFRVLQMLRRKIEWMLAHREQLCRAEADTPERRAG